MTVPGLEPEPSLPSQPPELVTKGSPSVLLSSHFFSPVARLPFVPVQFCFHSQVFPISLASCLLLLPLVSFRYRNEEVTYHLDRQETVLPTFSRGVFGNSSNPLLSL